MSILSAEASLSDPQLWKEQILVEPSKESAGTEGGQALRRQVWEEGISTGTLSA